MIVEVCANSLESALNAEKAGADRIELCMELAVGGITPSYGLLKRVKEQISIPVHVLIRPRSGDFTYSKIEFAIMKKNIALCVELGFAGIVSGVLHENFTLDEKRTKELIECAGDLKFTFHRAFDWVLHPFEALKKLDALKVDYILSSGQQDNAPKGIDFLAELQKKATYCTVLAGGGIRPNNVLQFKEQGIMAVHLSGIHFLKKLEVPPLVSMNSPSFLQDDAIAVTKIETIEAVLQKVK
ncbi:MAG: copper homeostasis protein CutC [Cellulophaga sp.]